MRSNLLPSLALTLAALFTFVTCAHAVPVTGGTGPGGVGTTDGTSSLRLWLRGDAGVLTSGSDVTQWVDQSGNGSLIIPPAVANRPTYTGAQNGVPVLTFNPGNPGAGTTQHLFASPTFTIGGTGDATTYAAYKQNVGSIAAADQNGLPFFARTPVNWFGLHANDNNPTSVTAYTVGAGVAATVNGTTGGTFAEGTWGTLQGTHASVASAAAYTDLTFGFDSGARYLIGDIGEVVIFNDLINTAQQTIVQNYVSSKFDTLLAGAVDKYTGDTGGIGDYDYDVFGIGRVDSSNEQTNTGQAGFGIEATSGLDDGEFVLAGHKVATNGLTAADVPTGLQRWTRVWYVDTNGSSVETTLSFGWSDSGLVGPFNSQFNTLYYSPTDPFSFTALAKADGILGDQVFFNLTADQLQNGYYTLGSSPPIPEPSSFLLLLLGCCGLLVRRRRRKIGTNLRRRMQSHPQVRLTGLTTIAVALLALQSSPAAAMQLIPDPLSAYLFDEPSGSIALDERGDNDANLISSPTRVTGAGNVPFTYAGNGALDLTGAPYVQIPLAGQNPSLNLSPSSDVFSFSAWVRTPLGTEAGTIISRALSTDRQYQFFISSNRPGFRFGTTDQFLGSGPTLGTNWGHVAMVVDGSGANTAVDLYLNGTNVFSTANFVFAGTAVSVVDTLIGARRASNNTDTGFQLDALVDEIAIFDVALTPGQVNLLANNSLNDLLNPPPIPEPSTFLLLGLGAFGLASTAWRRRRRRA